MKKCDLLIVTAPVTDTAYPLQAPAVIKSAVIKHGFTAHTYDINYNFFKEKDENHDFLKNYFSFGTLDEKAKFVIVQEYVDNVCKKVIDMFEPRYIAVSIFTYQCQTFAKMFAQSIKKLNKNIRIIFGGQGLTTQGIESKITWAEDFKKLGFLDHYIISEGENAIVNLLQEGKGKGIDNLDWMQETDLDKFAYPDYKDYNLDDYDSQTLMITGSRGCVRKCSFCDIHKHWKKFVFRSGQSIADEMIYQSEKYKKYRFHFTDSLINGSMKAYRDFITIMAKHNENAVNKIRWRGQFIVRGKKSMTANDWKLTKLSGAEDFAIGVESGSENVRDHMKKQFSDNDLDEFMYFLNLHDIKSTFLIIIGYPTETWEDFLQTLKMFKKYRKYKNVIQNIQLGSTLGILPGTPLADEYKDDIEMNNGENFWIYSKNPKLDFKERIKRRIIAEEECRKMGYHLDEDTGQFKLLQYLWNIYKKNQKQNLHDLNTDNLYSQKYS